MQKPLPVLPWPRTEGRPHSCGVPLSQSPGRGESSSLKNGLHVPCPGQSRPQIGHGVDLWSRCVSPCGCSQRTGTLGPSASLLWSPLPKAVPSRHCHRDLLLDQQSRPQPGCTLAASAPPAEPRPTPHLTRSSSSALMALCSPQVGEGQLSGDLNSQP